MCMWVLVYKNALKYAGTSDHRIYHEGSAHGVGRHQHDFNAHPNVVPATLVVLKGHVRRVVVGMVRGHGRLVGDVPRHLSPVNHLCVDVLGVLRGLTGKERVE